MMVRHFEGKEHGTPSGRRDLSVNCCLHHMPQRGYIIIMLKPLCIIWRGTEVGRSVPLLAAAIVYKVY